jgi:hypothetical protein
VLAEDAVVVEDSANGLRAALAAGIRAIVTVSAYTREEDFAGAALVVSSLGEPGEPAESLHAVSGISPGDEVGLDDVIAVFATPSPAIAQAKESR